MSKITSGDPREDAKLLSRVIVRLTIALTKYDDSLVSYKQRFLELVRGDAIDSGWRQKLDELATNLLNEIKNNEGRLQRGCHQGGEWLFNLLKSNSSLVQVQKKVLSGEIRDSEALLREIELRRLAGHGSNSQHQEGLLRGRLRNGGQGKSRLNELCGRLANLLAETRVPWSFNQKALELRERLCNESNPDELMVVAWECLNFLGEIRLESERERDSLGVFLEQVTRDFSNLQQHAEKIDALTRAAAKDAEQMQTEMQHHIGELRDSADRATSIDDLKKQVKEGLDVVSHNLDRASESRCLEEMMARCDALKTLLLEKERETNELRARLNDQTTMAFEDELTGLPNRRAYEKRLTKEVEKSHRLNQPLSLLVWDVDHFKSINDRFGHQAGDQVLIAISKQLLKSVREQDFVARYGGEEIVMILPGMDAGQAITHGDFIRNQLKAIGFTRQIGCPVVVTASCGIAELMPGETGADLFARADQALYRAKRKGRDRCIVAEKKMGVCQ